AVITDDNPRSEESQAIFAPILEGIKKSGCCEEIELRGDHDQGKRRGYLLIPDRRRAISAVIEAAGGEDIVLIAGKGHEQYQLTREGRRFFDDSLEAAEGLSRWNVHSLALATRGRILQKGDASARYSRVSTDSRSIRAGDVFVALKGDRFDGHHYVEQVVAGGGTCLVLEREVEVPPSVSVLLVEDTERALGDLAAYRRAAMKESPEPIVAAITGSSGKTTVKEMCAAIFCQRWPDREDRPSGRVLKTEGNYNNLIGLPLSLLPVTPRHRGVILEMGMNRPGEIARLAEIADPDIACIINVHGAHLQGLGDIDGVARAKGELFQTCGKDTLLVINNDDERIVELAGKCSQQKIVFGFTGENSNPLDVWTSVPERDFHEESAFTLHVGPGQAQVTLQVPGVHNVANALAAAAIAHAANIDLSLIARGLASYVPTSQRMQILGGPDGSRVINDTYNANPASMKAGIDTLSQLGRGRRVAILADMLELGPDSEELHREIGAHVAAASIDFLAVLGDFAPFLAAGAVEKGMEQDHVRIFSTQDDCLAWLKRLLGKGSIGEGSYILVKGSRGMHLENLVEGFVER
ncbi:MAG: UDP-N-acetylmuramoyl-tripeptide--D-alanyl-D-alanine ligase, partial [Thermodesulfobacteriota bacterium]